MHWADQEVTGGNRYGVTTWGSRLAHIMRAEVYSLEAKDNTPPEPAILAISQTGNNVTITWDGDGQLETSASVNGPWAEIGREQPGDYFSGGQPRDSTGSHVKKEPGVCWLTFGVRQPSHAAHES